MGICGSNEEEKTEQVPTGGLAGRQLTIYGDWFDSDTRTIMTVLSLSGI